MPPPTAAAGKASRAAAISSSQPGPGGNAEPGSVHFRSLGGETATRANATPRRGVADRRHVALQDGRIGARLAVCVEAGNDGLEHQLRAERRAEPPWARMVAASWPLRGSKWQTRNDGADRLQQVRAGRAPRRHARPAPRARCAAWRGRSEPPTDTVIGAPPAGGRRRAAFRAGSWPRAAGSFRPSAAGRARGAPAAARRSCRRRPSSCDGPPSRRRRLPCGMSTLTPGAISWVRARMSWNGQAGSISSGKLLSTIAAVGMLDGDGTADHAVERMQHDEAGAVGDEVAEGLAVGLEGQAAVGPPLDPRPVAEGLRRRRCRPRRRSR